MKRKTLASEFKAAVHSPALVSMEKRSKAGWHAAIKFSKKKLKALP